MKAQKEAPSPEAEKIEDKGKFRETWRRKEEGLSWGKGRRSGHVSGR